MRRWVQEQLAPLERATEPLAIVLDPEDALQLADIEGWGDVEIVHGWYELRRAYEQRGRGRASAEGRLVLLVRGLDFREARDLPFDIEQAAAVAVVQVPGPPAFRELLLELPEDLSDAAAAILRREVADPLSALVSGLWRAQLGGGPTQELELVIRLLLDPTVPPALWRLLAPRLSWEPARALAAEPRDPEPLQRLWSRWATEGSGEADDVFRELGARITPLFHVGLLRPVPTRREGLPAWARIGLTEVGPRDRLEELLSQPPEPHPPADLAGWIAAAQWWGEVRAALAEAGPEASGLKDRAWDLWGELDRAFRPWLQGHLGELMLRSTPLPITVDKIAPFLARRLRERRTDRILLVVLDGMGLAQWSLIRRTAGLSVLESTAVFAMVPTLTPVSRQAILAGTPPLGFPETIRDTGAEASRWQGFWASERFDVTAVSYARILGAPADEASVPWSARVVGLVVTAIDEMLHGARVLGDAQVAAGVRAWADHGFLRSLIDRAVSNGFEVWVTADHGNLESYPLGQVQEGLMVEAAGVRVRWYTDPALRRSARVHGLQWDPPGLPEGACYPLFAPGRGGYFSGEVRVTHGGISLDEVIVPLAWVGP